MSKSKLPIPPKHKATALTVAKGTGQNKVYITEDGHAYIESNKALLEYHCRTNGKTYWEVEAEPETVATEKTEKEEKVLAEDKTVKTETKVPESAISAEDAKKMAEAAGSAGANTELIEKLKGLTVEKLAALTKDVLKGYADALSITVADTDTKPVIAEAILKVVNA